MATMGTRTLHSATLLVSSLHNRIMGTEIVFTESKKLRLFQKYNIKHQMHFKNYDEFYSQYSLQNVSAGISAIFRVKHHYKNATVPISPSLHNNQNYIIVVKMI
jgi:hypothetical protein